MERRIENVHGLLITNIQSKREIMKEIEKSEELSAIYVDGKVVGYTTTKENTSLLVIALAKHIGIEKQ